ncbi:MAG: DUF2911 domain-containing protein [Cyclobacteriaceae bacterium]|nr:DUF2911 domain-containing protein [Cyclobacteriaceae bacterium]
MKKINLLAVFVLITLVACGQKAPKSPRLQTEGKIQGATVAVDYGAPSVRGRTIWGGLEKYGKVWRAGANENTTVSFDQDVIINGKALKAGKYGFFIIPNESGDWVAIFNSKNDAWGASSYNQEEDVLRVNIKPSFVDENQEQLKFSVSSKSIDFAWGKARLAIAVSK